MPYKDKPAFRCNHCGHLHGAEHAGLRPVPFRCPMCGHGAIFKEDHPTEHEPDCWEVLALATEERLKELGLTLADVARHTPDPAKDAAENLARCKDAYAQLETKRAEWEASKAAVIANVHTLDDAHLALAKAGPSGDMPADVARHSDEVIKLRQRADDEANKEFTDRDAARMAKLKVIIDAGGYETTPDKPRSIGVTIQDRSKTFDRHN